MMIDGSTGSPGTLSRTTRSGVTTSSLAFSFAARGTNSRIDRITPSRTDLSRSIATPVTAVTITRPASYREAFRYPLLSGVGEQVVEVCLGVGRCLGISDVRVDPGH